MGLIPPGQAPASNWPFCGCWVPALGQPGSKPLTWSRVGAGWRCPLFPSDHEGASAGSRLHGQVGNTLEWIEAQHVLIGVGQCWAPREPSCRLWSWPRTMGGGTGTGWGHTLPISGRGAGAGCPLPFLMEPWAFPLYLRQS